MFIFSLLSGAQTPARWSSSSWPSVPISSSTSSTPWRLTWQRRACCQRWRRPSPKATRTHTGSPWQRENREEGSTWGPPSSLGALGDSQCFVWAKNTKKTKKTTKNYSLGSFHFIWVCLCSYSLWISEHQCFQVELVNYCTVPHFHYSQLVSIHTVEQSVGQLYISTCIQDILYIPINVFYFSVLMHCSQPRYSLYCSPSCTPSPDLSFNFLCCDCFYLYIDGFYIWYVLLYLNVVSVLFRLNSLLPSATCIHVCVFSVFLLPFIISKPNHWHHNIMYY